MRISASCGTELDMVVNIGKVLRLCWLGVGSARLGQPRAPLTLTGGVVWHVVVSANIEVTSDLRCSVIECQPDMEVAGEASNGRRSRLRSAQLTAGSVRAREYTRLPGRTLRYAAVR